MALMDALINKIPHEPTRKVIKLFRKKFNEAEVMNSGAAIAFYLLLSIFPILIAVGNLLPLLQLDIETVLPYIESVIPSYLYDQFEETIIQLFTSGSGGLFSIAALGGLWSASKGMMVMQITMDKAYGVGPRTNLLVLRLVSVMIMAILVIGLAALILVFSFGQLLFEFIQPVFDLPLSILEQFEDLRWPVALISLFLLFGLLYYFVPYATIKLTSVLPGTVFSTIGWLAISEFFAIYVEHFATNLESYGAISTLIVLLLWLNASGVLLTLGAVINAAIDEYRNGEAEESESRLGKFVDKKMDRFGR